MKDGFLDNLPDLDMPESHRKRDKSFVHSANRKDIVQYIKMKCPKCGGARVPVYSTRDLPVRHHKCSDCGHNFDSIEQV